MAPRLPLRPHSEPLDGERESRRDKQTQVSVIGGGPAGSAAAISALSVGARVRLFEPLLDRLGLWQSILDARPSRIAAIQLHFHNHTRKDILPEAAFGLSRFQFDRILMEGALAQGAKLERARGPAQPFTTPTVLAHGRKHAASHPSRLFGFKAHFHGPVDDSTDLFFFPGGYCGVNTVENEITNVCGLASWRVLSRCGFHYDELVHSFPPLARRLVRISQKTSGAVTWRTHSCVPRRHSWRRPVVAE